MSLLRAHAEEDLLLLIDESRAWPKPGVISQRSPTAPPGPARRQTLGANHTQSVFIMGRFRCGNGGRGAMTLLEKPRVPPGKLVSESGCLPSATKSD